MTLFEEMDLFDSITTLLVQVNQPFFGGRRKRLMAEQGGVLAFIIRKG